MASKTGKAATNGSGQRREASWIDAFVTYTDNLTSPPIFRKWAAIMGIAAILEQRVWINTGGELYPNLYTFLVGPPGVGKSRAIKTMRRILEMMPEKPFIAPTSVTMAALVDHLVEAKRVVINLPDAALEYNSMLITADELSAFMHEYSGELVAGLTTFYDTDVPYGQGRRVKDIRIMIKRPQLNIISGTTPAKLDDFIPPTAWDDGFTSRIIMVYSGEPIEIDIFAAEIKPPPVSLVHDLTMMQGLIGKMGWSDGFAKAMNDWKKMGFPKRPTHPKLQHYCTRREAHMLKLSMIANIDRGNDMFIDVQDFNRALGWLLEAEQSMGAIFKTAGTSTDSKAMDEIYHFVKEHENGVSEHMIVNFARTKVEYALNAKKVVDVMEQAGLIRATHHDKASGLRMFKAQVLH